jgi:transcriptional regulator with XRE-family HTH domain
VSYWADVAKVVNDRMSERGVTQQELAERSGVSTATLRKIQGGGEQKRTRSTLASISRALGLGEDHLWRVSRGETPDGPPGGELLALRTEVAELARRVEALESQMAVTADR